MGWTSITATPEPLGPVLPLLEGLHSRISATSVLPSLQLLSSVLSILSCCRVAKQRSAPCSKSLAEKVRHTVGQGGQSWGWEKMVSAGVVPLHDTLVSLTPESPPSAGTWAKDDTGLLILESCWLISHVRECSWGCHNIHSPR